MKKIALKMFLCFVMILNVLLVQANDNTTQETGKL